MELTAAETLKLWHSLPKFSKACRCAISGMFEHEIVAVLERRVREEQERLDRDTRAWEDFADMCRGRTVAA